MRTIPFGRPWIFDEDKKAVLDVLDGPILAHGPQAKALEAEFQAFIGDGAHCVSVSSGMAALHLAYLHFGIGAGDEVIVPAQTHVATANAVAIVGATPVFVDCDPATGNVTAETIAPAITSRTRAISLVHFAGIPCEMSRIIALADRHGLKVVEDCALGVGSRYRDRHVGVFGDVGCFSFYPVKHLTTAEGGMFVSRHADVAASVATLRAHGVDRSHTERTLPGMYDVVCAGLNYRLSEIQAALGRGQIKRLPDNLARRGENFRALATALRRIPGVRVLDAPAGAVNSHYCLSVVLGSGLRERRDDIARALNAKGVGTSVYYPQPVPRMTYYRKKYSYDPLRFPHAEDISDHSIALPVGPHLGPDDMAYIAEAFTQVLATRGGS